MARIRYCDQKVWSSVETSDIPRARNNEISRQRLYSTSDHQRRHPLAQRDLLRCIRHYRSRSAHTGLLASVSATASGAACLQSDEIAY
jgi:hypothetical protein